MDIRKRHNQVKSQLLHSFLHRGQTLLDVGCGRGGDIHKWNKIGATVTALEPDMNLLMEAHGRLCAARYPNITLMAGDIREAPKQEFDLVTYMFSIHWTLLDNPEEQLREAMARVKKGGRLAGTVPNGNAILKEGIWASDEGQFVVSPDTGTVQFNVQGPFYGGQEQEEPILTRERLQELVEPHGGQVVQWSPLGHGNLSEFYCMFVVVKDA